MVTRVTDTSQALSICGRPICVPPERFAASPIGRAFDELLKPDTETFDRKSADLKDSPVGPIQRGELTRGLLGPLLTTQERFGAMILSECAAVQREMDGANSAPVWGPQTYFFQVTRDKLRYDKRWAALRAIEQAAQTMQMKLDPKAHAELIGTLLSVGRDVCGLSASDFAAIRVNLFAAMEPAHFATLNLRVEHIEAAQSALRASIRCVVGILGSDSDVRERAPSAISAASGEAPKWIPAAESVRSVQPPMHVALNDAA